MRRDPKLDVDRFRARCGAILSPLWIDPEPDVDRALGPDAEMGRRKKKVLVVDTGIAKRDERVGDNEGVLRSAHGV